MYLVINCPFSDDKCLGHRSVLAVLFRVHQPTKCREKKERDGANEDKAIVMETEKHLEYLE